VGAVLQAELGDDATPRLSTTSPSADGAARHWDRIDAFTREVADSRVHAGIHFRFSTDVGEAMGRQIGALAAARHGPAAD
jgi:hypothetical protein